MPTGYTAAFSEREVSFEEFVWSCARAFGALVMMRDDAMDAPIPERFEPSDYNTKRLEESEKQLRSLIAMSDEDASRAAREWYEGELAQYEKRSAEKQVLKSRYESMIAQVEAWTPPTEEHRGLREFMLNQLRQSMRFDLYEYGPPAIRSGSEHRAILLDAAMRDVKYHAEERAKEHERMAERNAWVDALRKSVGDQPKRTTKEGVE